MLFQVSIHSEAGPIKVDRAIKWMLFSRGIAKCFLLSDRQTWKREPQEQKSGATLALLQRETLSRSGCIETAKDCQTLISTISNPGSQIILCNINETKVWKCENETRREGIKIVADKHIYSLKQSIFSASKGFHQVCFMAQLTNSFNKW